MNESGNQHETGRDRVALMKGVRFLELVACVVVVVAGLKLSASLVIPILVAALISLVCIPPTRFLRRRGVPNVLAVLLVVVGILLALVFLVGVVGNSIREFSQSLGDYRDSFQGMIENAAAALGLDKHVSSEELRSIIDADALMQLVASTADEVLSTASKLFVIILIMIFILIEASGFAGKLRRALGDPEADLSVYERVSEKVHGYLSIKTGMSLLTGLLVVPLNIAVGVEFPVLWGLMAFLFNFVPSIGSIIAAIPPILLALIASRPGAAAIVAAGYVVINVGISNAIEPRLMGRRLGLSPLVVILSLIFWSWVWGPVGMILSVPMTMVVKIWLEQSEELSFIAVLLGPTDEPGPAG